MTIITITVGKNTFEETEWPILKKIYVCFINYVKALDCVDHKKLVKFLKEMGIQTTLLVS